MRPRNFVFITLLALCHLQVRGQVLTNALPLAPSQVSAADAQAPDGRDEQLPSSSLPDDPGQEILPLAQPEPTPSGGVPVLWDAQRQTRVGDTWTLSGEVVILSLIHI